MNNKFILVIAIILMVALMCFLVDFQRAKNGKGPIFCIRYSILKDGGTKKYIGLGYKVIKYNKLNGYNKVHIGTLFLKYDDELGGKVEIKPVNVIGDNTINEINNILNGN